ncbi:transcription-repair coupling factor [Peptococcaceae bacterium SCADC1_2_3]|jgi:transcription-repair coupling factor (superfamily II helicase)|nr:transcription-repair coupling factor [Peptococcaceae bacterium SCADC1_2_3]
MNHPITSFLKEIPEFNKLNHGLKQHLKAQFVYGLSGSLRCAVGAGLMSAIQGPVLVIVPNEDEAGVFVNDLNYLLSGIPVYEYPAWPLLPLPVLAQGREIITQRLKVLEMLVQSKPVVVIAPAQALLRVLAPPEIIRKAAIKVSVGKQVEPVIIKQRLLSSGYVWADLVEGHGQFCTRGGGILDVFPATFNRPVRIEFLDNQVEQIRYFNRDTQRVGEKIDEVLIFPASELVVEPEGWETAQKEFAREYEQQLKKELKNSNQETKGQNLKAYGENTLAQISLKGSTSKWEQYLPYFYPRVFTLLDYLPKDGLVMVDNFWRVEEAVKISEKENKETFMALINQGKILPGQLKGYVSWSNIHQEIKSRQTVYFSVIYRPPEGIIPQNIVTFASKSPPKFNGHLEYFKTQVKKWRDENYAFILLVSEVERGRYLQELLAEAEINAELMTYPPLNFWPGKVIITIGYLSEGFILTSERLIVVTETEIFGGWRKTRRKITSRGVKSNAPAARRQEFLGKLKKGDYVVHRNHGIGRYRGIITLTVAGIQKDYLQVDYAGEDKLYVPTDQIKLIQKYLGAESTTPPRLSRLGGSEWARVKGRVKEAVRELAQELINLYATRRTITGHAYSLDTVWQKEFEDLFPFEETPDQLKAIVEVKADMEKMRPMDRLLCGDVGYGKTEVALRAAFKAVQENKQVAVLVPTTILAQQHYYTFKERFNGYPVNIEMLSRFRSLREQKRIIKELRQGRIDIIIGTHRLIQEDVGFKNLGLAVIDEEQRFGVAHKEMLKQLKKEVDVLTLTATPIPRTLQMSLTGVRDTSLLETPPENRFPVQTYVLEEDPVLIREAIKKEINRGGQVFFVHNRIMELDNIARWLAVMVPEARLAIAHGQLKEEELEQVMLDFLTGKYEILLCTTIIENGLDMPNVNTLIVRDADCLGLAQLYQLRGRVGRSNRLAYAYFTFRKNQVINEAAEKRLAAIQEFTAFGSGYKIALRDLEIRGAGNLLGPEQHGHIMAVGFDLYCQLLEEAVREARGEVVLPKVETVIDLPIEAHIPESFILEAGQKISFYRRLAFAYDEKEVQNLAEEVEERFGNLPLVVKNLFLVARLRILASGLGIKTITYQVGYYRMQFCRQHFLKGEVLVALSRDYQNQLRFNNLNEGFEMRLKIKKSPGSQDNCLTELKDFIYRLSYWDQKLRT